jgi:hypothetical protein
MAVLKYSNPMQGFQGEGNDQVVDVLAPIQVSWSGVGFEEGGGF